MKVTADVGSAKKALRAASSPAANRVASPARNRAHPRALGWNKVSYPAPVLTVVTATTRMEALGQPFPSSVNSRTRHGSLARHRYDGNYGVITLAGT